MMKSTMRPIHSLLESNLLNRSKIIQSLTFSLRSRLPSDMQQHCWAIEINNNTLVLVTDSAERATILRYQQHELLKQINEDFRHTLSKNVRRIKVKVDYNLNKVTNVKSITLSRATEDINTAKIHCSKMMSLLD